MRAFWISLVIGLPLAGPALADDEFTPILTSDALTQLNLVGFGPDEIAIQDKVVRLQGKTDGYFATREIYRNYILKFEWMYERPENFKDGDRFSGNSGALLHIQGEAKVWPKCVEVQLENNDAGRIFGTMGGTFSNEVFQADRREAQKAAIKPVGEWNYHEIQCRAGMIRSTINDVVIDSGRGASPAEGPIGFQSEGKPIRFRFLRIKPLP